MRFATDENFRGSILRGLLLRLPDLDIVRVQDTALYQAPDPRLLQWLGEEGRILLTHNTRTMPDFLYARVEKGLPVPGIMLVPQSLPIVTAVHELEIVIGAGLPSDFENQVRYIPLR